MLFLLKSFFKIVYFVFNYGMMGYNSGNDKMLVHYNYNDSSARPKLFIRNFIFYRLRSASEN